jgi:putative OPT family oligopeptide transporter
MGILIVTFILGTILTVIMTAANVYLGLYAGMTVSASIPAAVVAMAVFRLMRRQSIHHSNIIQTMASAGESLAAGALFTLPALVLIGVWNDFKFWPTTLIGLCGGILGVVCMIPLRKVLIVEKNECSYPEGVACSEVLKAGAAHSGGGVLSIVTGTAAGAVVKLLSTGVQCISGSVQWALRWGRGVFVAGVDIAPALVGVGYIIDISVASLVFIGGAGAWLIGIPLLSVFSDSPHSGPPLDYAWMLWSTKVRYIGVGAMIVGGVWSIITMKNGIVRAIEEIGVGIKGTVEKSHEMTSQNIPPLHLAVVLLICCIGTFGLYIYATGQMFVATIALICMAIATFIFSAVSSYITGLVGSSNNPVSGMTISALLGTALLFLLFGYRGESAILATLGVAAVVCCAACTAGDCSQDLKTGFIIGTSPRIQQYAQLFGVFAACFVIAPVLSLLHATYGIGTGLKAPQAMLFTGLIDGIFGKGTIPYDMVTIGLVIGLAVVVSDTFLQRTHSRFRLYCMPLAVGIYLPFSLSVPIVCGGIIRVVSRKKQGESSFDTGILLSSGMIAGEAVMGVGIAIAVYLGFSFGAGGIPPVLKQTGSVAAFAGILWILFNGSRRRKRLK